MWKFLNFAVFIASVTLCVMAIMDKKYDEAIFWWLVRGEARRILDKDFE